MRIRSRATPESKLHSLATRAALQQAARSVQASRFEIIRDGGRFGHSQPVFPQSRQMKSDRLAKLVLDRLYVRPGGNAPRQIGHIGGVVSLSFFDHDRIAHYVVSAAATLGLTTYRGNRRRWQVG